MAVDDVTLPDWLHKLLPRHTEPPKGMRGLTSTSSVLDEGKSIKKTYKRDKSKNTPEFNKKAGKRRAKAKHDAKARKINRRK